MFYISDFLKVQAQYMSGDFGLLRIDWTYYLSLRKIKIFWISKLEIGKYYSPEFKLNTNKVWGLENMGLFHNIALNCYFTGPCFNLHNNELLEFIKLKHENPSVVVYGHQKKMYIPKSYAFSCFYSIVYKLIFHPVSWDLSMNHLCQSEARFMNFDANNSMWWIRTRSSKLVCSSQFHIWPGPLWNCAYLLDNVQELIAFYVRKLLIITNYRKMFSWNKELFVRWQTHNSFKDFGRK